jgi:predicted ArsR family transcriptional regulator
VSRLSRLRGPVPLELQVPTRREQIEAAVLAHLEEHGRIKAADLQALVGVKPDTAGRMLKALKERGVIVVGSKHAKGRSAYYVRAAG